MPLILAPSFDDHTREQVEAHLELMRVRRIAAALEYAQGKMAKLETEDNMLENKLARSYEQLGKALGRLDREFEKIEQYLNSCEMLKGELGLIHDRIELAKR
jgi:predicted nuclease with TOPRIM domain